MLLWLIRPGPSPLDPHQLAGLHPLVRDGSQREIRARQITLPRNPPRRLLSQQGFRFAFVRPAATLPWGEHDEDSQERASYIEFSNRGLAGESNSYRRISERINSSSVSGAYGISQDTVGTGAVRPAVPGLVPHPYRLVRLATAARRASRRIRRAGAPTAP